MVTEVLIHSEEGKALSKLQSDELVSFDNCGTRFALATNLHESEDRKKYNGLEITTFDNGYPLRSTYGLGWSFTKASLEDFTQYLSEKKEWYNPEIQKGSYAGAIAARRQYNLQQMIETLQTSPSPWTGSNDPKVRIRCDYYHTGTELFVIKAEYDLDGWPAGAVRHEALRINLNRHNLTEPANFTEKTVEKMVKDLYPKGFGSIAPMIPSEKGEPYMPYTFAGYNVFEVPPAAVSMIENFSEITLHFK